MSENNSQSVNNHENNLNKDDIIKLRREARRRKILDNAANRLEKLNGTKIPMQNGDIKTKIEKNDETKINTQKNIENLFGGNDGGNSSESLLQRCNDIASTGNRDEDIATELLKQLKNFAENQFNLSNFELSTPSSSTSLSSSPSLNDFIFDQNNDLYTRNPLSPPPPPSSSSSSSSFNFMQKILIYRLHLILLALIVYCTKDKLLIDKYSIFLPLLIMKLIEILFNKYIMKSSTYTLPSFGSYLDIVLLLGGISPRRSRLFLKVFNFIVNLIQDIAFYLFSFTMIHLCIGKNNYNVDDNLYTNIQENIHDEI